MKYFNKKLANLFSIEKYNNLDAKKELEYNGQDK